MNAFFDFSATHLSSALLALIPGVINLAILLYGTFRLPRTQLTLVFNFFVLALMCWQLNDAAYRFSTTEEVARLWDDVFSIGYLAVGPLALHFALHVAVPAKVADSRLVLTLLYLPFAFFTVSYLATPVPLNFEHREFWGFVNASRPGTIDEMERTWTSLLGLLALGVLLRKMFLLEDREKKVQVALIACGLGVPVLQGVITELIFPMFLGIDEVPLTSAMMTCFSLAAIVVLSKYKMFSVTESIPVDSVLENLTSFLFVVSPAGKVVYVNTHAANVFGIDRSAPQDFSFSTLFHEGSAGEARFRAVVEGSLNGTCVKDFEIDFYSVRGKKMSVVINTREIRNNGVLQGVLVAMRDHTEQKQAERELEKSISLLEATLESTADGILVTDYRGRIIRYNSKFAQLWRVPPDLLDSGDEEKALRHVLDQLIDPEGFLAKVKELYATRSRYYDTLEFRDGRIFERYSQPQRINGRDVGRVWSFRDITERKKAEQTLIQSEQKYKKLFESNPQPMWIFDKQTLAILDVNPAAIMHYGYSKEEFLSMTLKDIRPPEDVPYLLEVTSKITGDRNKSQSVRHRKKNGDFIYVDVVSHQIDYDGVDARFALINDVTERKAAEEKIMASEQLLSKTQQITHIGSYEYNLSTGRVYWSDELFRIHGLIPQERELTIDDFLMMTHPEDRESVKSVISSACQDFMPYSFYYRAVRKDGEIRIIHGQGEVTCDSQARGLILRGVAKDVTEQKHAEEKLEQQNEELLKANAELDRFVYSASHEMRAPLASILGLINISRMQQRDPEQLKIVDMMQASIQRLDTFIKSIADYSRNARLELEQEKIDFRQLIDESVSLLLFMEDKDKIRMIVDVEGEGDFYSDRRRLEVVLNNFISNAIKYHDTRKPDPFIRIRARFDAERATLEVTDNGTGIPGKYLDKIFNIFYRATPAKSGSGLGLYIVKEIVTRMSGTIQVDSAEGEGSTFTVSFPNMKKVEAGADQEKMKVEA